MADVEYQVLVELMVKGQQAFNASFVAAANEAGRFAQGMKQMGSQIGNLATDAARFAAKATAITAGVGATAATMAAIATGKNLSMLEDKSIQLGAVIAASTGQGFAAAQSSTAKLFEQFRTDAITSAGETKDFVNVASMISGSVLGAGRSMEELRTITQGVVATAPALGASFEQAGSDVMRMFQGHAGSELPFFRAMQSIPSLGIGTAEAFNKLDLGKRMDLTKKALRDPAFIAAAEAMGNTWTGLSSTMTDQIKTIAGAVGSPVFEHIKKAMKSVTDAVMPRLQADSSFMLSLKSIGHTAVWLAKTIQKQWAGIFPSLGDGIDTMADRLRDGVLAGALKVVRASGWIVDHWDKISAGAERFGTKLEHAFEMAQKLVLTLGKGDAMKGLERVAEGAMEMKIAGFMAPIAGPAGSAVMKALTGGAGTAGGAGGAVAAGGITAASAAMFAGIAAAAAGLGLELVAAIQLNLGGLGDWFMARWEGFKSALMPLGQAIYDFATGPVATLMGILGTPFMALLGLFIGMWQKLFEGLTIVLNALTHFGDNLKIVWNALEDFAGQGTQLAQSLAIVGAAIEKIREVAEKLGLLNSKPGFLERYRHDVADREDEIRQAKAAQDYADSFAMDAAALALYNKKKEDDKFKPGGAGQKIEVVLKIDLSNDNEEAIFVKGRREIKKAFDMAQGEARLMGSTLYGAHR